MHSVDNQSYIKYAYTLSLLLNESTVPPEVCQNIFEIRIRIQKQMVDKVSALSNLLS